jgi:hypothetical protein
MAYQPSGLMSALELIYGATRADMPCDMDLSVCYALHVFIKYLVVIMQNLHGVILVT